MHKLEPQQNQDILKILDEALQQGPWQESNFLTAVGKKLQKVRDSYAEHVGLADNKKTSTETESNPNAMQDNQQLIFLTLYSTEGERLESWEPILSNLTKQSISRPIYARVEDVLRIIKSKINKINEAYVAISVKVEDILVLPPEKTPRDRFDNPLITLKDRAIKAENIREFVHLSQSYSFVKGHLVLKNNSNYNA